MKIIADVNEHKHLEQDIKTALDSYISEACSKDDDITSVKADYHARRYLMSPAVSQWEAFNGSKVIFSGRLGKEEITLESNDCSTED
jgi:hypothetical protein